MSLLLESSKAEGTIVISSKRKFTRELVCGGSPYHSARISCQDVVMQHFSLW